MDRTRLMIVDDEADLLAELKPLLERSGFDVVEASNGELALEKIALQRPDLIVLDLNMPRMDGRDMLRRLRQSGNWIPVILLTQVDTPGEKVLRLQDGADDYLNKPFDPLELVARVQAILRRTQSGSGPRSNVRVLISGVLSLDRHSRQVSFEGEPVALTSRAIQILEILMLNPHEIIPRDRLLDEVWGLGGGLESRAVDARIAEIRKGLMEDPLLPKYIETVVGIGYRFLPEVLGEV